MGDLLSLTRREWRGSPSAGTLEAPYTLSGPAIQFVTEPAVGPYAPALSQTWQSLPLVADRVRELLALPENWDSYGASEIRDAAALTAATVAAAAISQGAHVPWIVPTVSGGVQLEWHTDRVDLELEIESSGSMILLYRDLSGDEVWEGKPEEDLSRFHQYLSKVVQLPSE